MVKSSGTLKTAENLPSRYDPPFGGK